MDFLNSYAFEQMAREYNLKYNTATALSKKDDEIYLKVKNDFEKICRLFYILKNYFSRLAAKSCKLNNIFKDFDNWIRETQILFGDGLKIENINKSINHKQCAIMFIELLDDFIYYIDSNSENKSALENSEKVVFFQKARQLYIDFFKIIKNFYMNI